MPPAQARHATSRTLSRQRWQGGALLSRCPRPAHQRVRRGLQCHWHEGGLAGFCFASYWIGMAHHLLIHTASALHSLSLHTWSSFLCIRIVSGLVFVVRRGFIGASLLLAWSPVLVRETSCPIGVGIQAQPLGVLPGCRLVAPPPLSRADFAVRTTTADRSPRIPSGSRLCGRRVPSLELRLEPPSSSSLASWSFVSS